MKLFFLRFYWILNAQLGINPIKLFQSLRGFPRFVKDFLRFRAEYSGRMELVPCLTDWYEEAGATKDEYFWQDLVVAQMINKAKPERHVDIGSRVDGFVAHVASFREIEIFDIRPITTTIPGVTFKQANLMSSDVSLVNYCDSLSCLHALEHFGLGRYGDPIDPLGHESGLSNMSKILKSGGRFYLSLPLGIERVEFNANRVFDPLSIINLAAINNLSLYSLALFTADDGLKEIKSTRENLISISLQRYSLGIFTFIKQ